MSVNELSERWQKEQKVQYWPDIAKREDPADYAHRLTDHTKDGGFYNTSPRISPQGDRIAFISNRDDYFDVFVMNTIDGSIQQKLVKGQRTPDFEELHLITPGMAWSPDGRRLALAAKSGDKDAIIIIDANNGKEEKIEFDLDGIFSVDWSPVADSLHPGDRIAFAGSKEGRSDIYTYNLGTKELKNLTSDVFTDADPAWSSDGSAIYFSSDRKNYLDPSAVPPRFKMQQHDFHQLDLYRIDVASAKLTRITDEPNSDETSPVAARDGKHLLFVSDMSGINNIYLKDLDSGTERPLTNSITGVYQLSLSEDGQCRIRHLFHASPSRTQPQDSGRRTHRVLQAPVPARSADNRRRDPKRKSEGRRRHSDRVGVARFNPALRRGCEDRPEELRIQRRLQGRAEEGRYGKERGRG